MDEPAPSLLDRISAREARERLAVSGPDGAGGHASRTYGQLDARMRAIAAALLGDSPSLEGAAVALLAPPSCEYVEGLLGILRAGGCAVPISVHAQAPEIEHQLRVAPPDALIATAELAARLDAHAAGKRLLILDEALPGARRDVGRATPRDARALMLFTSGTTGKPKGVVITRGGVEATLTCLEQAWRWRSDDRLLHVLPLHHTHGLVVALMGALWAGASARFARFEPAAVWDLFPETSVFMAVPTIYAKLVGAYEAADEPTRRRWSDAARAMRLFTSGSAALASGLHAAFERATGQAILERYGMTEIGMALGNPYDGPRVPGSVGLSLPGVHVDIVAEDGTPAARAEPGEIRVRSPQMFLEYAGDAAATRTSFDEAGRFRTGDTAMAGDDGYVRILGRTSTDIIKSGGYKLSALEIEQVLCEHEAIGEAAVLGMADPTWGEVVTACVVLRAGRALALDELRAWCGTRLSSYKIPHALHVMAALPRNAMGKIQKGELRRML